LQGGRGAGIEAAPHYLGGLMEENYFIHFMRIMDNVGQFLEHLLHEAQTIEDTARIKDVLKVILHDAEIKFDALYGAGKWEESMSQAQKENQNQHTREHYREVEKYLQDIEAEGKARKREELATEALDRRKKASRAKAKQTKKRG